MRYLIFLLILFSCGKDNLTPKNTRCDALGISGDWSDDIVNGNRVNIKSNCNMKISNLNCSTDYELQNATTAKVSFIVTSYDNGVQGCPMFNSVKNCNYQRYDNTLELDCSDEYLKVFNDAINK